MPDPLHIFIGDVHAGSSVAVMAPFTDHDGVKHGPSRVQYTLLRFWQQMQTDAKKAAKGHDVALMLGGDMVDGVGHHGSTQTIGDGNDQVALAVQLLLPFVSMSKTIYALLGTDAHVGPSGQADVTVAKELGAEARYRWRLDCSGHILDWAHHTGLGRLPWTRETALARLGNRTIMDSRERGQKIPSLIVRHHAHLYTRAHVKGLDVIACPGWQAQTSFTRRLDPGALLSVGCVLWFPKSGEIRPLIYEFPDDTLETARYAR